MSNYDKQLVDAYLAGDRTLDEFTSATGQMPLGFGLTTRFVAMMKLLERIDRDGKLRIE